MSSVDIFVVLHAVVPVPLCPIQLLYRIITAPISVLPICHITTPFDMLCLCLLQLLLLLMLLIVVILVPLCWLVRFLSFPLITILQPLMPTITIPMTAETPILIIPSLVEPPIIVSFILTIRSHKSTLVISVEGTTVVIGCVVGAANGVVLFGFVVLVVSSGVGWFFPF